MKEGARWCSEEGGYFGEGRGDCVVVEDKLLLHAGQRSDGGRSGVVCWCEVGLIVGRGGR